MLSDICAESAQFEEINQISPITMSGKPSSNNQEHLYLHEGGPRVEGDWLYFIIQAESLIQDIDDELTAMAKAFGIRRTRPIRVARFFEKARTGSPHSSRASQTSSPAEVYPRRVSPLHPGSRSCHTSKVHSRDAPTRVFSMDGTPPQHESRELDEIQVPRLRKFNTISEPRRRGQRHSMFEVRQSQALALANEEQRFYRGPSRSKKKDEVREEASDDSFKVQSPGRDTMRGSEDGLSTPKLFRRRFSRRYSSFSGFVEKSNTLKVCVYCQDCESNHQIRCGLADDKCY